GRWVVSGPGVIPGPATDLGFTRDRRLNGQVGYSRLGRPEPGIHSPCLPNTSDREYGFRTAAFAASGMTTERSLLIGCSGHLVADRADPLDPDFHHVAGLEVLPAPGADASRRPGEHKVAGMKRQPR